MKPPKAILSLLLLFFVISTVFTQPVERPPRPGEPIRTPQPEDREPVVDRPKRGKHRELKPFLAATGGTILSPSGTWGTISIGATYGPIGFGMELGYADYEREFIGCSSNYMSPGESEVSESGSFFRPTIYGEYSFDIGPLLLTPRATLGYADIVCRRWESSSPTAVSRFERRRLVNTWELGLGIPIGPVVIGATAQWWVVNPWFYLYPEDFGLVTMGASVGMR